MSKKNKTAPSGKKTEVDIEKLDRYVSRRSDDELAVLQVKKSVFFIVSVALLLITMFLPSDSGFHKNHGSLISVFSTLNIIGLIYALYMFYQDNRKHKIRKTVLKVKAPHFGFDKKFTYLTYEIFVVAMLFFLAEQCVIVYFARDAYAIVGLCLMVASVALALVSRFVLVKANCGYMELFEAEPKETEKTEAENAETKADNDNAPADDFYASPESPEEE